MFCRLLHKSCAKLMVPERICSLRDCGEAVARHMTEAPLHSTPHRVYTLCCLLRPLLACALFGKCLDFRDLGDSRLCQSCYKDDQKDVNH